MKLANEKDFSVTQKSNKKIDGAYQQNMKQYHLPPKKTASFRSVHTFVELKKGIHIDISKLFFLILSLRPGFTFLVKPRKHPRKKNGWNLKINRLKGKII